MNLEFLSPLLERAGPWASVYFDTSAISEEAAALQELQARGACERLAELGCDEATCRAVYDRLTGYDREVPGRAVFATDGEVVADVPLGVPPPSPPLSGWNPLPRLGPLLDFGGRDPACLVAYVDRRGADVELRGVRRHPRPAGGVEGERQWPMHRTATADWSERHFQLSVENTWEENAGRIAEALAADAERTHAEVLVLAGDPRERRSVRELLPEALRAVTVESDKGGRAAGSDNRALSRDVEEARASRAKEHVAETMDRFRAGRAPERGRIDAVEGVPALVDAAREHRIDALLMRSGGPDLHRDVWVGHDPDQLAVRRTDSQYLGDPVPTAARADDALMRSASATGAEVVALPGPPEDPGQLPVGGLGALLRWPYQDGLPGGGFRATP